MFVVLVVRFRNDLPILVSETESKVESAKIKLKELESITVKYIDALRAAVQDNNVGCFLFF
ncbi:unnamed protein product [Trichobilharzia regenti]|nr:unnamed protein product [Trichobilharzia regenti]